MKRTRVNRFYVGASWGVGAFLLLLTLLPGVDHPSGEGVVFGVLGLVGTAVAFGLVAERSWRRGA